LPESIDFALEAGLKFWPIYMKSIPCSSPQYVKIFDKFLITVARLEAIYHDSSLNRRHMENVSIMRHKHLTKIGVKYRTLTPMFYGEHIIGLIKKNIIFNIKNPKAKSTII